jgi:hypothetical protein
MTTQTKQIRELDNLETVDELVLNMRSAIESKISQLDDSISQKRKKATGLIRISHEEASAFIADHLKTMTDTSRKKVFRSFEAACYLRHHHDVPQISHIGHGAEASFRMDTNKKPIEFNPTLYIDPIDLVFAFNITDAAIEKFASECAAYFECKKGDPSSAELLERTTALVNETFGLLTQKKELQTRFESLMAIPAPPKPPEARQENGNFVVLPARPGYKPITIAGV